MSLRCSTAALRSSRSVFNSERLCHFEPRREILRLYAAEMNLSLTPHCVGIVISTRSGEIFPSYGAENARSLTPFEMTNQSDAKFSLSLLLERSAFKS